jgi:zinc and cadmium transporter
MTLAWILAASIAGGALSVLLASVTLMLSGSWVPMLVSYAIGALLGAAFLEVIPHMFATGEPRTAAVAILAGIFGFFVLEKLLLWRHCHVEDCEAHDRHAAPHDHGRSGVMIMVGDTVHNFVDGLLIAAAFLESPQLGIVTALAIIAHEIPQEVGDFVILLHSGFTRARAFAINLLSSLATIIGGVLGYFTLQIASGWKQGLLGVVAASMIYIAVADLIPGLHKRPELKATVAQASLIALGIASVAIVGFLLEHSD